MSNYRKHNISLNYFSVFVFLLIFLSACNQVNFKKHKHSAYSIKKIFDLPKQLTESSGIIFYDSLLWTFNDGGHYAEIYGIDLKTGGIKKEILFADAKNIDWEDIAQDASSVYIGDIGNKHGMRQDLCIYKISKSSISSKEYQKVKAHKIKFSYADQINFTDNYHSTPFDCEALVCTDDSLLLFTKNWQTHNCAKYLLPKYHGSYIAHKIDEFDSDGLVTGADYDPVSERYILCGHKNNIPFVLLLKKKDLLSFIKARTERFDLTDLNGVQVEGIAFCNKKIFLTSEKSMTVQALYQLKLKIFHNFQ
jgi:hypothetical protein